MGICGRTGSGKSSLAMSILNMVPNRDGTIRIDGIDIDSVPLQSLRSRISVIPQDVKMFGGTIRQNLDLKNEYSDNEIWSSLRMAQMEDTVKLHLGGLGKWRKRFKKAWGGWWWEGTGSRVFRVNAFSVAQTAR